MNRGRLSHKARCALMLSFVRTSLAWSCAFFWSQQLQYLS